MNFLSKLGKNVLTALSNMKESNASLMAKVYVKLARSSSQKIGGCPQRLSSVGSLPPCRLLFWAALNQQAAWHPRLPEPKKLLTFNHHTVLAELTIPRTTNTHQTSYFISDFTKHYSILRLWLLFVGHTWHGTLTHGNEIKQKLLETCWGASFCVAEVATKTAVVLKVSAQQTGSLTGSVSSWLDYF